MLSKVHSGAVYGVDAYPVEIEVNSGGGDPQTVIVGLPDAAVKESKDRVHTAIVNSGFKMPKGRLTVNLAPADIKKEGPSFHVVPDLNRGQMTTYPENVSISGCRGDLPIAMGVLATIEEDFVPQEALKDFAMVGELALSGEVRRVRGVLPIVMAMREEKRPALLVPLDNADETAVVEGLDVYPVSNLRQAADFVAGRISLKPYRVNLEKVFIGFVLMGALTTMTQTQAQNANKTEKVLNLASRETVLDRKVHIEATWVKEIPEVPRWCDELGLQGRKVDIGDCKLYCDEEGSGMPMVLLHGGPGATHHYFHPWFSMATNFAHVIYYDQRGCGQSDYKPGAGYSTSQAVDDLEKLRQVLKIDRWVVVGHSYGGYVSQQYAVKYPDHLAGLVLIGAQEAVRMRRGTRQYDYLSQEERQKIAAAFSAKDLTPEQRIFNAHLNGDWKRQNFYRPTSEDLARMTRYEWVHDPTFRTDVGVTITPNLGGYFDVCPIPTLIVEGKWDLTWRADKPVKMQAALPKAELVVFEKSGHSPFADEPELFFARLEKCVRQLTVPSASDLAQWEKEIETVKTTSPASIIAEIMATPEGWGSAGSTKIVKAFQKEWLDNPGLKHDDLAMLRLGFALYDEKRYAEALEVFKAQQNLVWQGQMLDLLDRREEAVQCYQQALKTGSGVNCQHDQYGITIITPVYVQQLIKKPFVRIENRMP